MYTCPEREIMSVYLDNELPAPYKAEFEAHLVNCADCRKQYEKLQNIRTNMQENSVSLEMTEEQLHDSFEKLQTKLHFRSVTNKTEKNTFVFKLIPAIAAAAVFAFIIPIRLQTAGLSKTDMASLAISAPTQATLMKNKGIVTDTDIKHTTLASFFNNRNQTTENNNFSNVKITPISNTSIVEKKIPEIDIFHPDFSTGNNSLTITITLNPFFISGQDR